MFVSPPILYSSFALSASDYFFFQQVRFACIKDQYNFIEYFCHACELANETLGYIFRHACFMFPFIFSSSGQEPFHQQWQFSAFAEDVNVRLSCSLHGSQQFIVINHAC